MLAVPDTWCHNFLYTQNVQQVNSPIFIFTYCLKRKYSEFYLYKCFWTWSVTQNLQAFIFTKKGNCSVQCKYWLIRTAEKHFCCHIKDHGFCQICEDLSISRHYCKTLHSDMQIFSLYANSQYLDKPKTVSLKSRKKSRASHRVQG